MGAPVVAQAPSAQELQRGKDFMQKSMGMMKPELLEKAKALPPDPHDLAQSRVGGPYASVRLGESGLAGIAAMSAGKKTKE